MEQLTKKQAEAIADNYADQDAPGTTGTTLEEWQSIVTDLTGKTRKEAAQIMWPENPEEQLRLINEILDNPQE